MCTCGLLLSCLSSIEPFPSWGSYILSEIFFPLSFLGASGGKQHAALELSAATFFLVIKSVFIAVLLVLNPLLVPGGMWLSMITLIHGWMKSLLRPHNKMPPAVDPNHYEPRKVYPENQQHWNLRLRMAVGRLQRTSTIQTRRICLASTRPRSPASLPHATPAAPVVRTQQPLLFLPSFFSSVL